MAITASIAEYWSKRMQVIHHKKDVFRAIASFEERANLRTGDTFHRPYRTALVGQNYTRSSDITLETLTTTDDSGTVNLQKTVSFYIDSLDEIQHDYKILNEFADDGRTIIGNLVDGEVLYEAVNATSDIDDADINAGTADDPFVFSTSNCDEVFSKANMQLDKLNISQEGRFAVISPQARQVLIERLAGKESSLGDSTGMNGHIGKYMGFDLHVSNSLMASARWTPLDNPANGATITIEGVSFNFVSTIGTTAGNILQDTDTATTIDNVVALINNGGVEVTAAQQQSLSAANQRKVQNWTAVDGTTYLEVRVRGASSLTLATSEAADLWSKETQHNLFGQKGAIDLVIQAQNKVDMVRDPDRLGHNVHIWTLFGKKTFADGAKKLVDVKLDSSNF